MIDVLVKAIFVYDDYIKLILTFDDKPIDIPTTEEIENMANSSDIQSNVSPNVTNPNYFVNRNWFGFVFTLIIHIEIPQIVAIWLLSAVFFMLFLRYAYFRPNRFHPS